MDLNLLLTQQREITELKAQLDAAKNQAQSLYIQLATVVNAQTDHRVIVREEDYTNLPDVFYVNQVNYEDMSAYTLVVIHGEKAPGDLNATH